MATVEPVVAGAVGVILLGEALTAPKLLGALLVLASAVLALVRLEKTSRVKMCTPKGPTGRARVSAGEASLEDWLGPTAIERYYTGAGWR